MQGILYWLSSGGRTQSKVLGQPTCVTLTPLSSTWVSTNGMPWLFSAFLTSGTDLDCKQTHCHVARLFKSAANAVAHTVNALNWGQCRAHLKGCMIVGWIDASLLPDRVALNEMEAKTVTQKLHDAAPFRAWRHMISPLQSVEMEGAEVRERYYPYFIGLYKIAGHSEVANYGAHPAALELEGAWSSDRHKPQDIGIECRAPLYVLDNSRKV